ncbi:trissin receptor, partial [Biomphalaria glabrata]
NSVVLYAIAANKRMRTRTNFFLANLAVADLSVGVVCIMPKLVQYLSSRWLLGE